MKINELLNESDIDIEKALDAYNKKKELEKSRSSTGSAFKRGFWKGKTAADNVKHSKPVQIAQNVLSKFRPK